MDTAASDIDLREAARLARESVVVGQAVTLGWLDRNQSPSGNAWASAAQGQHARAVLAAWGQGPERYGDTFAGLEGASDEDAVRVRNVLTPGSHIDYTYDFGAGWEHEIAMVKIVEDPEEPEPFNVLEVNRKLATLARTAE